MKRTALTCLTALLLATSPLYADEAKDVSEYKQQVIQLNKDIGTYYFISDRLSNQIEDAAHQQLGSVQDFLINHHGEVEKIVGQLNNMGIGETILNLDYSDLSQGDNAYVLAYKAEEMEEKLATFLANIETASGVDAAELVSARRLQGRNITLPGGEPIGQVEQVITDQNTQKVVGVLMKNIGTRPDYERFALPYPNGLRIKNTGFANNLEISEDFAGIIQEFTAEGIPN